MSGFRDCDPVSSTPLDEELVEVVVKDMERFISTDSASRQDLATIVFVCFFFIGVLTPIIENVVARCTENRIRAGRSKRIRFGIAATLLIGSFTSLFLAAREIRGSASHTDGCRATTAQRQLIHAATNASATLSQPENDITSGVEWRLKFDNPSDTMLRIHELTLHAFISDWEVADVHLARPLIMRADEPGSLDIRIQVFISGAIAGYMAHRLSDFVEVSCVARFNGDFLDESLSFQIPFFVPLSNSAMPHLEIGLHLIDDAMAWKDKLLAENARVIKEAIIAGLQFYESQDKTILREKHMDNDMEFGRSLAITGRTLLNMAIIIIGALAWISGQALSGTCLAHFSKCSRFCPKAWARMASKCSDADGTESVEMVGSGVRRATFARQESALKGSRRSLHKSVTGGGITWGVDQIEEVAPGSTRMSASFHPDASGSFHPDRSGDRSGSFHPNRQRAPSDGPFSPRFEQEQQQQQQQQQQSASTFAQEPRRMSMFRPSASFQPQRRQSAHPSMQRGGTASWEPESVHPQGSGQSFHPQGQGQSFHPQGQSFHPQHSAEPMQGAPQPRHSLAASQEVSPWQQQQQAPPSDHPAGVQRQSTAPHLYVRQQSGPWDPAAVGTQSQNGQDFAPGKSFSPPASPRRSFSPTGGSPPGSAMGSGQHPPGPPRPRLGHAATAENLPPRPEGRRSVHGGTQDLSPGRRSFHQPHGVIQSAGLMAAHDARTVTGYGGQGASPWSPAGP